MPSEVIPMQNPQAPTNHTQTNQIQAAPQVASGQAQVANPNPSPSHGPNQPQAPGGAQGKTAQPAQEAKVVKIPTRNRHEREFLPAALEIVETPSNPVSRFIGLSIVAMTALTLVWACVGQVDIISTGSGHVITKGKTKVVQPLETGMVTSIKVADGDHVKAGDVLIELNAVEAIADRDHFRRDLTSAELDLAKLRGLARNIVAVKTSPTPTEVGLDLVDPPGEATPEALEITRTAMISQAEQQEAKIADIDQQIVEKQQEAAQSEATVAKLNASLPMVDAQEKIRRQLMTSEYGNKLAWYQANQQLIEQTKEIDVEQRRKAGAEAAVAALQHQRAATEASYKVDVLQELDKTQTQVSELQASLTKAEEKAHQSVLTAPIDGTVQQLAIHTVGGVVTPAEQLMSIVPDSGELVVEAMIPNRDVGFVKTGQTARVKVDSFNFTRYGLIDGTVLDVTRDAIANPSEDHKADQTQKDQGSDGLGANDANASNYMMHIALKKDTILTENGEEKLLPGMQVSAEVQTGRRRVIEYLLSPIVRHISESAHER